MDAGRETAGSEATTPPGMGLFSACLGSDRDRRRRSRGIDPDHPAPVAVGCLSRPGVPDRRCPVAARREPARADHSRLGGRCPIPRPDGGGPGQRRKWLTASNEQPARREGDADFDTGIDSDPRLYADIGSHSNARFHADIGSGPNANASADACSHSEADSTAASPARTAGAACGHGCSGCGSSHTGPGVLLSHRQHRQLL